MLQKDLHIKSFYKAKGIKTVSYDSLNSLYSDLKNTELDAIVADLPVLSYYASHEGSGWMLLAGEPFNLENLGILFPDKSALLEQVNRTLLEFRENGEYSALYEKYFGEK